MPVKKVLKQKTAVISVPNKMLNDKDKIVNGLTKKGNLVSKSVIIKGNDGSNVKILKKGIVKNIETIDKISKEPKEPKESLKKDLANFKNYYKNNKNLIEKYESIFYDIVNRGNHKGKLRKFNFKYNEKTKKMNIIGKEANKIRNILFNKLPDDVKKNLDDIIQKNYDVKYQEYYNEEFVATQNFFLITSYSKQIYNLKNFDFLNNHILIILSFENSMINKLRTDNADAFVMVMLNENEINAILKYFQKIDNPS